MVIRRAVDGDWPRIWPIFRAIVAAGETYAYALDTPEDEARRIWTQPPSTAYVAVDGDKLLGTYMLKPNQAGPGSQVANAGFMVAADAGRRGVRACAWRARARDGAAGRIPRHAVQTVS